jgi:hypothetical protein
VYEKFCELIFGGHCFDTEKFSRKIFLKACKIGCSIWSQIFSMSPTSRLKIFARIVSEPKKALEWQKISPEMDFLLKISTFKRFLCKNLHMNPKLEKEKYANFGSGRLEIITKNFPVSKNGWPPKISSQNFSYAGLENINLCFRSCRITFL